MSDDFRIYATLRRLMTERFDESDLHTLCFDIGLDYDDLGGDTKGHKIVELLQMVRRTQRLQELLGAGKLLRPDIGWDVLVVIEQPPAVPPAVSQGVAAPAPEPLPLPEAEPDVGVEAEEAELAEETRSTEETEAEAGEWTADEWGDALLATLGPFAHDGIFYYPAIPAKLAENIAAACQLPEDESILVLVDCTVDGSSKFGAVFGLNAFYFRNDLYGPEGEPGFVPYEEFPLRDFARLGIWQVSLGEGQVVNMAGSGIAQQHLVDMLVAAKRLVLGV
jgi:hypothetical protein